MKPTDDLTDELFRDKVRAARRMSLEEKFLAGAQLFEYCCRIARDGIRMQNPGADDDEVERLLERRLAIARRLEESP